MCFQCFELDIYFSGNCLDSNLNEIPLITKLLNFLVIFCPVFTKWRMSSQYTWHSASLVIHPQEWLFCFSWFFIIITWVREVGKDQFYRHTPSFGLLIPHIWDWFVCFSWRACMHCHFPGRYIINHSSDTLGWPWYILEAIQVLMFSVKQTNLFILSYSRDIPIQLKSGNELMSPNRGFL